MGRGALPTYRRIESFGSNASYAPIAQQSIQDPARTMYQGSRNKFVTAQDLFDYTSTHMPLPASSAGSLKQEEYWAIVNFLLVANGAKLPPEGVTPANAKTIAVPHP
jgi:hypothetical protein